MGGGGGGGGEVSRESRHILSIALSEHHVDYMNREGWSLRYYAGGGGGNIFTKRTSSNKACVFPS